MPKVVLATIGSYGDLNPYLAIGIALSRLGADVVVAATEGYRTAVERHGLGFAPMRPHFNEADDEIVRKVLDRWRGAEYLTRKLLMPAVEDMYEDLNRACEGADLLVSHVLVYAAKIVAEHRKIPWMMAILQPLAMFSAYEMPIIPPLNFLKHFRFLGPGFNSRLMKLFMRANASWGEPVQDLRRKLGLEAGRYSLREALVSPYGVLAMFPEAFASKQPDWPASAIQCGFPFLNEDFTGAPMDSALRDFLADGDAPVIFTLGSSAVRVAPWFTDVAAVAAGEGKFRAVILAGPAAAEAAKRYANSQIRVVASAPYYELFPSARAIVHSGGIGTTAQALRSGRPQVVIPFAFDQFDNAERIVRLGCGVELPMRKATQPQEIREAIARADTLAGNAQRLKGKVSENGSDAAANAILRLIASRSSVPNRKTSR